MYKLLTIVIFIVFSFVSILAVIAEDRHDIKSLNNYQITGSLLFIAGVFSFIGYMSKENE